MLKKTDSTISSISLTSSPLLLDVSDEVILFVFLMDFSCRCLYSQVLICKWILLKIEFYAWLHLIFEEDYVLSCNLAFQNFLKVSSTGILSDIFLNFEKVLIYPCVEAKYLAKYINLEYSQVYLANMKIRTTSLATSAKPFC